MSRAQEITRAELVKPWCFPEPASTVFRDDSRLCPFSKPTGPDPLTKLLISFALVSKGGCTSLTSLVSLACSSGLIVIHGGTPTLWLRRRPSYLIVNQEIQDRPRQETSWYQVHAASSKENNQADKCLPYRDTLSSKLGLVGLAGVLRGSAQAKKTEAFWAGDDSYIASLQPPGLELAPFGVSTPDQNRTKGLRCFQVRRLAAGSMFIKPLIVSTVAVLTIRPRPTR